MMTRVLPVIALLASNSTDLLAPYEQSVPHTDKFFRKENTSLEQVKEPTMTKIDKVSYTAKTHTTGGREGGACRSDDGRLDVKISPPGTSGTGTNPVQLFAAGWSACFLSSIKIEAGKAKVKLPAEMAIDAEVDLGKTGDAYPLAARLNISLPGIDRQVAEELVHAAHQL